MNDKTFPTYADLRANFRYNPRHGKLYKLKTPNDVTDATLITCPIVRYKSLRLSTAQVIWMLVTGNYAEYVMRIDRNPKNNLWSNLKVHKPTTYKKHAPKVQQTSPKPAPEANHAIVIEDTHQLTLAELLLELSKPE